MWQMGIQDDIQASGFRSEFHRAMVNLYYTYKWYDQFLGELFGAHQLLPQHFNVLMILKGRAPTPATPKEIKAVMLDHGRDLTRLIDKLVKMGYVKRHLNPDNRRQMLISLTEEGRKVVEALNETFMDKLADLNQLSDSEAMQLSALLDKVRQG
jgi:DNA-binding MarR family transcriptional regulator